MQDLYTIVKTGWESYAEYLAQFSNHSTLYTAVRGADQLLAVEAARAMPDEEQRTEVHATLRVQMIPLAEECLIVWSNMSTYIRDGFPKDEYDNKRLAAGYAYYAGAEHRDWDDVKGLMQNGLTFATANAAELGTGGMPITFMPSFIAAKDAFELKHNAFLQAEEQAKVLGDAKVVANNTLYIDLTKMFEDGKKIFREEAAIREQFTFDRVWNLVGNPGSGTGVAATVVEIGVYFFDDDTELPLEGAQFTFVNAPGGVSVSAVSDANGVAVLRVSGFSSRQTVLMQGEVSATDYESDSGEMEVTAGNFYSVEVPMRRIV